MEPMAGSIQHTYRSPQTVGKDGDGGTSRIDGFCVPEAMAPVLRYPEMQIAEPTDNAYYDHVPIRCELLMGNIQPIRQMRDQFRYPTKYLDNDAISPQLHEGHHQSFGERFGQCGKYKRGHAHAVSGNWLSSSNDLHVINGAAETHRIVTKDICGNFFLKQSGQGQEKLSLSFGNSSNNMTRNGRRSVWRIYKKRNIDKLATAPAEIYAMVRGEYKENPTVSALQHSSGHMVTGKASVEEILMHKWRTEVFDPPPSAGTPEFR